MAVYGCLTRDRKWEAMNETRLNCRLRYYHWHYRRSFLMLRWLDRKSITGGITGKRSYRQYASCICTSDYLSHHFVPSYGNTHIATALNLNFNHGKASVQNFFLNPFWDNNNNLLFLQFKLKKFYKHSVISKIPRFYSILKNNILKSSCEV